MRMTDNSVDDAALRRFLLGNVDETERERIEKLFIIGSLRERMFVAEDVLLEEYLDDLLSEADKQRFLAQFGNDPNQRRRLGIHRSIRDWAIAEHNAHAATASTWSELFAKLNTNSMLVAPLAAATLIFIVVAAFWIYSRAEEKNKHLAIEREVAQLNASTSTHNVTSQTSLSLKPGVVRGTEQQTTLWLQGGIQIVELRLLWMQKDSYSKYQSTLSRIDNNSLTVKDLFLNKESQMVIVKLPAHILTAGSYEIKLTGIGPDGSLSPAEEYQFTVSR